MAAIGVLGPGGVGGLLAARFGAAGHDVTVLATETTSAALTAHGLTCTGPDGSSTTTHPTARTWLTTPLDVLFIAVKATELLPALGRVPASTLGPAAVVPLLNGIDHLPLLRASYPAATVVAASIAVEATRHRPGVIEQLSTMADLVIADGTPAGRSVAELSRSAGLTVATTPEDLTVLWRKLCFLAPFALLTTSTNTPLGPARTAHPERLRALVDEATSAAASSGVAVDADAITARLYAMAETMQSSMLKDYRAGKPLELDAIAGPIIRTLTPTTTEAVDTILQESRSAR